MSAVANILDSARARDAASQLLHSLKTTSRSGTPSAHGLSSAMVESLYDEGGGKMLGVLVCTTPSHDHQTLRAFSGQLGGRWEIDGWVPPIARLDQLGPTAQTTERRIQVLSDEIGILRRDNEEPIARLQRANQTLAEAFQPEIEALTARNKERRATRQRHRQRVTREGTSGVGAANHATELAMLDEQSRQDKSELRQLKREYEHKRDQLHHYLERHQAPIKKLQRTRKQLSRELTQVVHNAYWLTNFQGERRLLPDVFQSENGIPTGTGECCAPKLLNFAATHGLKPIGLAELWVGKPSPEHDRVEGQFYAPCEEKCGPILEFMLSGLPIAGPTE